MDVVFHLTIPALFLFFAGANRKHLLALLPLAIILDAGTLLNIRKGLHSFFFIFVLLLALYTLMHVLNKKKETKSIMAISAFYLFSHLLLDLGNYMALFYPFSDATYALQARIVLINFVPVIMFGFSAGMLEDLEQGIGGILTEPGIGILLMAIAIILYLKTRYRGEEA